MFLHLTNRISVGRWHHTGAEHGDLLPTAVEYVSFRTAEFGELTDGSFHGFYFQKVDQGFVVAQVVELNVCVRVLRDETHP